MTAITWLAALPREHSPRGDIARLILVAAGIAVGMLR